MRKAVLFASILSILSISASSQKIGIGTSTPIARLEVKGEGSSTLTNNLVLRNSSSDILLRMRDDGRMTLGYNGITVGRPLNIGGNGVNFYLTDVIFGGAIFPEDTSLVIWSEFGDNKFVILQPQWGKVGIGTSVPKVKLHVRNGISNATPHSNAVAAFESSTNGYINLLTPNSNESGIFFGNPTNAVHGGIVYNSTVANGLAFRTNGNQTRMVIASNGNTGIGTTSPEYRLHVVNDNANDGGWAEGVVIENTSTTGEAAVSFRNTTLPSNRQWNIGLNQNPILSINYGGAFAGSSTKMAIDTLGNTGIGTITPLQKLHVVGNGFFEGVVIASCGILSCSDIRYKNRLAPLTNTLTSLMSLHGIYYYWDKEKFTDKAFSDSRQIGFSAQEVELVFPEMVYTDASGYKMVDYSRLTPVLVEAIKEQQYIIDSQQVHLEAQALKLESLEKEMQELKSLVLQMASTK